MVKHMEQKRLEELKQKLYSGVLCDVLDQLGYLGIAAETVLYKKCENAYKVVRCSFENCTTRREDKKLVLTTGKYLGAFNKRREITVLTISDCVGLDSVKQLDAQSGSYERAKPYEPKTKTVLGEPIGCEEPELPARVPGDLSVIFL